MKFVDKLVVIGVLLVLAVCIAPTISATDYSQMEKRGESVLSDPNNNLGILAPIVHVDTSQVTVNYISTSTTTTEIGRDIGAIIGMYAGIVYYYPEVGDLLITAEDIHENPVTTFTCLNSWVVGLDSHDTNTLERLVLKVILTAKTV